MAQYHSHVLTPYNLMSPSESAKRVKTRSEGEFIFTTQASRHNAMQMFIRQGGHRLRNHKSATGAEAQGRKPCRWI